MIRQKEETKEKKAGLKSVFLLFDWLPNQD